MKAPVLLLFICLCAQMSALAQTQKTDAQKRQDEVVKSYWDDVLKTFGESKPASKPTENKATNTQAVPGNSAKPEVAVPAPGTDQSCLMAGIKKQLDGSSWYLRSENERGWIKLSVSDDGVLGGSFCHGPVANEQDTVSGIIAGNAEVVKVDGGCSYLLKCVWKSNKGTEEVNYLRVKPGVDVIGTLDDSKHPWGGIRM